MLKIIKRLHSDQRGSYFVEMALTLIGVAFVVFGAANGLAKNGIVPKYQGISTEISNATVPSLQ